MSSPTAKAIRVLIVDDHQVVRLGLRTLLSRFPHLEVVGEAATASDALSEAARLLPEVVLLDVRLPDASGPDICRKLKNLQSRVLMLTANADDRTVLDAVTAGADGYLLKEIDSHQLVHAIEAVASGKSILDPGVTSTVLGAVREQTLAPEEKRLRKLSGQEERVLGLVAQGKTNKEIAAALGLSDKTVKNYFSSVLEKLQVTRRSQAAAFFAQHRSYERE